MNNQITLFLIPEEAVKFKEFQKHYELFMLLLEKGVFQQKNAAVTLHFDPDGTLRTIQRADVLYKK